MTTPRNPQTLNPRRRRRPVVRLAGATSLLAASAWCLLVLGRSLPPPPGDPGEVVGWVHRHGAAVCALTVLRAGALVAVAYLLVVGVLGASAQLGGAPRIRILLHHLPRRVGPRLVDCGLGVGAAAGLAGALVPSTAAAATATTTTVAPPEEPALMVPLEGEQGSEPVTTGRNLGPEPPARPADRPEHEQPDPSDQSDAVDAVDAVDAAEVMMHSLDPAAPEVPAAEPEADTPVGGGDASPEPGSLPDAGASDEEPPPAAGDTWLVARGDHLWSIAAETVGEQVDDPDDQEVFAYWQRLVSTNHDRLVDPANPDLLFPGQVLHLPTPVGPR